MKKTQKSFKKKALLSSLSMLMVATVAVGSATFAWFKTSPEATASGLTLKATASNGLKILTQSHKAADSTADFASQDYLKYDANGTSTGVPGSSKTAFLLTPATFDFPVGAAPVGPFTTTAAEDDAPGADTAAAVTSASTGYTNEMVYKEQIACKLVGAANDNDVASMKLKSLSVTFNSNAQDELRDSARILLTYKAKDDAAESVIGVYAREAGNGTTLKKTATAFSQLTNDDKGTYTYEATTTPDYKVIGDVGTSGEDIVTVYIYLDGQDSNCFSKNIKGSELLKDVTVNLTIGEKSGS